MSEDRQRRRPNRWLTLTILLASIVALVLGSTMLVDELKYRNQSSLVQQESQQAAQQQYQGPPVVAEEPKTGESRTPQIERAAGPDAVLGTADDVITDIGADDTAGTADDLRIDPLEQTAPAADEQAAMTQDSPGADPVYRPAAPDPSTFAAVGSEQTGHGPRDPEDSDVWQWMQRGSGDSEASSTLPDEIENAWACPDNTQIDTNWQLSLDQARSNDGSAVILPSVCTMAPTTQSDMTEEGLDLPYPPWATWYEQSPPAGSEMGNTIIASHLGYLGRDWSPFRGLSQLQIGAPVVVRDAAGEHHVYEVVRNETMSWSELSEAPDMFSYTGAHRLTLITCTPGAHRNVVVTAVPVD